MKFACNEYRRFRVLRHGKPKECIIGRLRKFKYNEPGYRTYSWTGSSDFFHLFNDIFGNGDICFTDNKIRKPIGNINFLSHISHLRRISIDIMRAYDVHHNLKKLSRSITSPVSHSYVEKPIYFVQELQKVYDIEDDTKYIHTYVNIEPFLTYDGAKDFIDCKQQFYNELRIHIKPSIGNEEWTILLYSLKNYFEIQNDF